jgi:hypothetical protein
MLRNIKSFSGLTGLIRASFYEESAVEFSAECILCRAFGRTESPWFALNAVIRGFGNPLSAWFIFILFLLLKTFAPDYCNIRAGENKGA